MLEIFLKNKKHIGQKALFQNLNGFFFKHSKYVFVLVLIRPLIEDFKKYY